MSKTAAIASRNPATGELLEEFEATSAADLDVKLNVAAAAFLAHRRRPFSARASILTRAAEILEAEKERLGRMITIEMGKVLRASIQEVEKCAAGCRYYAEHGEAYLREEPAQVRSAHSFVRYQPLGPVLAVMPWNFPFWQVFRFAAPTIMAGNVCLLKHASNVPRCALAIEDIFRRSGAEDAIFQTLLVTGADAEKIIADERVAAVSLTGSVEAGRAVASTAGKHLKKSVLELGGSDPFIVMPSSPLESTVEAAVQARIVNNGQSCIAAKRFIVHRDIAKDFERRFVDRVASLRIGDPLDPSTELGPLATEAVLYGLQEQVDRTVAKGARLLLGGKRLNRPGWFFSPTVLANIPPKSPAARDELFGPAASLWVAESLEHALEIANDTTFGLGSSLWSKDPAEHEYFIENVRAGMAFVNGMVVSDPAVPFGGVGDSGYGRELGRHGILEFVNAKAGVVRI